MIDDEIAQPAPSSEDAPNSHRNTDSGNGTGEPHALDRSYDEGEGLSLFGDE